MLDSNAIMEEVNNTILTNKILYTRINSEQLEILGNVIVSNINKQIEKLCAINNLILP